MGSIGSMMSIFTRFLFSCLLFSSLLFCAVHHIHHDGSGDFSTIQEGIDGASEGDTVLVYPGRYYENLNFNGKDNLTLASLELIAEAEEFIDSTIIDGNNSGSCIRLSNEEQNAVIRGFSLTNGFGSYVSVHNESGGGGVLIFSNSSVNIINSKIFNNFAILGGGISTGHNAELFLSGVTIKNNIGIGLRISTEVSLNFDTENRCNIYNNYPYDIRAVDCGEVAVVLDTFTVLEPDEEYFAYHFDQLAPHGGYDFFTFDILHGWMELVNEDLYVSPDGDDQNSGLTPDEPLKNIAFAVHRVQSDSLNPKTVHVAAGEYHWDDGQIFPIYNKSYVNLIGDDIESTFLINNSLSMILLTLYVNDITIENFTLQGGHDNCRCVIVESRTNNIHYKNMIIEDCITDEHDINYFYKTNNMLFENVTFRDSEALYAGIYCPRGNGIFRNCTFNNLHSPCPGAETGHCSGGLYFICNDSILIENCIFSNSSISTPGEDGNNRIIGIGDQQYHDEQKDIVGSLFINNTSEGNNVIGPGGMESVTNYINCTFTGNQSTFTTIINGGNFYNCILYNPTQYEVMIISTPYGADEINVSHSLIQNGIEGICLRDPWGECNTINSPDVLTWLEGNLDTIPYFTNPDLNDYSLQWISPCVDAGTLDLPEGIVLPEFDLAGNPRIVGNGIDMGAFELQPDVVYDYDMDWNLVGAPVSAYDFTCPTAYENTLYSYHPVDGYVLQDTLISGIGYWYRFEEDGNCVYTGPPVFDLLITLHEGWNLISGISVPIDVDHIMDLDGLIIPGTIYGYDVGYENIETIDPGYGYWLRSYGDGNILLSSNARILHKTHGHLNPQKSGRHFNTLTVNNTILSFGAEISEEKKLSYSLPPKPPAGAKDIRFSDNTKICGDNGVIDVMNPDETLVIEYNIKDGEKWELIDENSGVKELWSNGVIELPGNTERMELRRSTSSNLSRVYSMSPAYPNPFNPTTTIQYVLPERSDVQITIYDLLGKKITTLISETQDAGYKSVVWDASNLSSGVYFYHIRIHDPDAIGVGDFVLTRKMVLLK